MAEEGTEADILHTGDLVLLKCQMSDREMFAEASEGQVESGYVCCDGLKSELKIMAVEDFHDIGNWDIREFLFQVVGQLTYITQKDLNRFRKQLKNQSTEPTRAQQARLATLEERARIEELENEEKSRKRFGVPLHYGEVIQLLHVRTGRFVRVCPKLGAVLQRTSRRVDLHEGTSNSFLRLNPLFRHKMQGQRVLLNEQVLLESARLGNNWNLNWTRCKNMSKDDVLEVNCSITGRGFYLMLYQRDKLLESGVFRLGYSLPLVLRHHHFTGNVTASSSRYKPVPFLRSLKEESDAIAGKNASTNSKDLWLVEPASVEDRGSPISWGTTRVYLRHFASGRYLAVAAPELVTVKYHLDGRVEVVMPESPGEMGQQATATPAGRKARPSLFKRAISPSTGGASANPGGMMFDTGPRVVTETRYGAELVGVPGPSAVFTMHPTDIVTGQEAVPRNACIMLKWDDPVTTTELWLSCQGKQKGKRKSMALLWSETKMQRDAIGLSVIEDRSWLNEADVVSEHVKRLRYGITRRCKQFATDQNLAAMVCAQTEHALTDMIFFVSGSRLWRTTEVQTAQPDALAVPWEVVASRQRLVREMKYIDASMELFVEFVKQTQSGVYREQPHDIRWGRRAATLDVRMHVQPNAKDKNEESQQWGRVMNSMIVSMKTRCLKLLVRLWLFCLLGSRDTEHYFYKNKWVEVINGLNGHGLGASDVFVAIMSNNPDLARRVDRETLLKFVDFIKVLGPNSTYVNFMKSVCAPREMAIGVKQQLVLSTVVFPGERAQPKEQEEALNNRRDLFISLKLAPADTAMELGKALIGSAPSPLEECLAREVLTYGLSDVVISWAHCKRWTPGMSGYLYHSPESMGVRVKEKGQFGKAWVSLADIVWVLQPFRCAELVTGRKWTEEDDASIPKHSSDAGIGEDTSPMALRLNLAQYFLAQLHLVADMVKDRQINCMMALQEEYSFSLCLCGASDPRLPTSIRAAFFNLITELWLDRCPHTQVVVPALMQQIDQDRSQAEDLPIFQLTEVREPDSWSDEHKHSLSLEVQAFYRLGTPHKMEALMRSLRSHLCTGHRVEQLVHSEKQDILMMLSLLRVLAKLFRFGFVHSAGLLQELIGPLIRSLDGRTDLLQPLKEQSATLTRSRLETFGEDEMQGNLEPTTPLLSKDKRLEIDPSLDLGSNDGGRLPRSRFPPLSDGTLRYAQGRMGDNTISDCKVELLQIMLHTLQLGVHTKISRVLQIFRGIIGEATRDDRMARAAALLTPRSAMKASLPQGDVVEKVLRCLDDDSMVTLSCPGIRVPNVMCIDLMMYEDPKIFALALEMLFTNCCQASFVFENLDKVELLTSAQIELFHKIKVDVAALGDIIYSFENWGLDDNFSAIDMGRFVQLQRICLNIRSLCIMGDASTTPLEVQKMLHETEFFSHFDYVFKQNRLDFVASSRPLFAKMQALMCSVASRFIASNPSNQITIFNILPRTTWLLEDRSTGPDCSMLMVEVFRDNEELCQQVSVELIGQFGDLIKRERSESKFVPWYILFYEAVVQVGSKPVVRNQEMVMDAIKGRNPQLCLHLLQGEAGVERILELCQGFTAMGQLRDPEVSRRVSEADGELIYYARCVELLARMSRGRGSKTLVIKPFVNSIFPVESMMRLIVRTGTPVLTQSREGSEMTPPNVAIIVYLKAKWMQLVNILLYDVEKSLLDMDLLGSPLHVEFFTMMRDWTEQVLTPAMTKTKFAMDRQGSKASEDDTPPMLSVEDEAYAQAMLHCIDSFFQGPFFAVKSFEVCADLVEVALKYGELFSRFLRNIGDDQPRVGMRDVEHLIVTANRVVAATEEILDEKLGRRSSKAKRGPAQVAAAPTGTSLHMKTMSQIQRKPVEGKKKSGASSDMEAQWRAMLDYLYQDQLINERLLQEEAQVSHVIHHISEFTDPADRKYREVLPQDSFSSLPDGVDYRRNILSTEDILSRCVRHLQSNLRTDLPSVRRVQRMLLGLFHKVRNDGDVTSLSSLQRTVVKADVTKLIVQMLDSRVAEDVTRNAWTLLAEVLCTGNRDGDIFYPNKGENILLVDKGVQQSILDHMINGDDSGMWESARDEFVNLATRIKPMRSMRTLCMLTEEDILQQEEYQNELSYTVRILDALSLMVEGHYFVMQQYLHSQEGNSRSLNVPEMCANLLVRFCKDPRSSQLMDAKEIECTKQLMKVLTELMQGPNVRNQDFLCTQGVVETIMKLLAASFDVLKEQHGDYYPAPVRSLKAKFVETLLAFLDGRHDNKIHLNVLQRTDTQVLCDRVELVFRYFIFGTKFAAESTATAILPVTPENVRLLDVREDPAELHLEIVEAAKFAEELLEDLEDEELDSLFEEALSMLEFIYTLIPHSADFKKEVMPLEDSGFIDDLARFPGSESEWKRERKAYYRMKNYSMAFQFLARFVKTIEVVLDGHLQTLHFRQPLTAMWYVHGAAKSKLLDTIPLSPADIKAKAFLEQCKQMHKQSVLIRTLSRWSYIPEKQLHFARRHLPDWAHRPFHIFFCQDARGIQLLLELSLYIGGALAMHAGIFLVAKRSNDLHIQGTAWSSVTTEVMSYILGSVYLICNGLWVLLSAFIKVPLIIEKRRQELGLKVDDELETRHKLGALRNILNDAEFIWRAVLVLFTVAALFFEEYWLYTFIMLDIFCQNKLLATVLKAITAPITSLCMTCVGAYLVGFIYAALGFHHFRKEFGDYCDENIMTCTKNIMYQTTRTGIVGLSGMMELRMPDNKDFGDRMAYDMTYFIIFGIMLLNTIVGLIVDSFSALRNEQEARIHNLKTESFISCIERRRIEAAAVHEGFEHHEMVRQNKWDYMAFIFYLREKRLQDYTGVEQKIRNMVDNKDAKWLPINRSKVLEESREVQEEYEDVLKRLEKNTDNLLKVTSHQEMQTALRAIMAVNLHFRHGIEELMGAIEATAADVEGIKNTLAARQERAGSHRRPPPPPGEGGDDAPARTESQFSVRGAFTRSQTGGSYL